MQICVYKLHMFMYMGGLSTQKKNKEWSVHEYN